MNWVLCVTISTLVGLGLVSCANYEGYKLYKVIAKNEKQSSILTDLQKNQRLKERLNFWSAPDKIGAPVSVMVSPDFQENFEMLMDTFEISRHVLIPNFQRTLEQQRSPKPKLPKGNVTFGHYMRHEEINLYLDELAAAYPDFVTLKTIGRSFEGRNMTAIVISTRTKKSKPRPTIFIEAGAHAREWSTPAVALYIIHQLVEARGNKQMTKYVDWIILPSLNPDGYEYSLYQERTWARSWRKNRSPGKQRGEIFIGTDLNRNFGYHWEDASGRTSTEENSELYRGSKPFSEIETRNLRDFLTSMDNVELYLSIHSFGSYILYPWAFTAEPAQNVKELDHLGCAVRDAIKSVTKLGTEYTVGSIAKMLYRASGSSIDWAMGVANISLAYTIELPDVGRGFHLPDELIRPVVTETWEGVKVLHKHVENKAKARRQ